MLTGFTFDLKNKAPRGCPPDIWAEHDDPDTILSIESALKYGGHDVIRIGSSRDLLAMLGRLDCDIVFNIAEGTSGRDRESEVPVLLDLVRIPYTGPDALTLSVALDKIMTKKILSYHGILTPSFFGYEEEREIGPLHGMKFPLIVKPRYEGSAKGISAGSVVTDLKGLKKRVLFICERYKQPAIVEEFIDGWEFTAGVLGNGHISALPVVQRHLEEKSGLSCHVFDKNERAGCLSYRKLLDMDRDLERDIQQRALAAFGALECRDFARFDFRVSRKGRKIYLLEANPLPSLAKDDYFGMVAELECISYEAMINRLFNVSLERCGLG